MTVKAILRSGSVFRTAQLSQYDQGQMIHLSGVELPASYLAEFSNSETGPAEQITQTTDTVAVPDKYLTSGNPVYVWIVVVGEDERTTRYEIIVPVKGRGEPDDYTPTPSEQTAIEVAIAALNSAVEAAGVAIAHYPRITDGVWQVWDVTAGEWISTGVVATGNGIAGATLNQDYTLTLTFTNGETYTTPSIRGAQGPQGVTFTPAVSSEGVISWTNDGGKTNPQPVNIKGPQGDDYILTAEDKAEIAQQAAESLAPVLDEKATAIHTSAGPSAIASISDAAAAPVDSLTVAIEPVQDLHGYDHPWPGGGNKNLLQPNVVIPTTIAGGVNVTLVDGVYVFNGTATSGVNFNLDNWLPTPGNPVPHSAGTLNLCISAQAENVPTGQYAYIQSGYFLNGTPRQWNVSFGSNRLISTEVEESDVVYTRTYINILSGITYNNFRVKVQIEIGNTATAWTPYSNICPISGWTGAKVTRTGKNLIRTKVNGRTTAGITFTVHEDGSVIANGTATGTAWLTSRLTDRNLLTFVKAGTYTVSGGKSANIICYLGGNYVDGSNIWGYYDKGTGVTFTLTKDAWVYPQIQVYAGQICDNIVFNFQLELGSTATDYEP